MLEYRQAERATSIHVPEAAGSNPTGRPSAAPSATAHTQIPSRQSSSSSIYSNTPHSHPNARASHAQSRGFDAVEEVERKLRAKAAAVAALTAGPSTNPASPSPSASSESSRARQETDEERTQRHREEDDAAVKAELERYKQDHLEEQRVDLLDFWQVRLHVAYSTCDEK